MKMKVKKSIGFKMAVAMAAGLFVVISLFSHTNVRISEKRLLAMAEKEASKMSNAIESSLDDAMLSNELERMEAIVKAVGQESMVEDIKIIALDGEVRHAKNKDEIGIVLDQSEKSCALCHTQSGLTASKKNLTVLFQKDDGGKILRNVNPIHNDSRCHGCHAADTEVLGKLLIDFSTNDIDVMVFDNRKLLIMSAVATLLASIFICYLLATVLVKKPLHRLLLKMKYVADDAESSEDALVEGEDEVAILSDTYDNMMAAIDARNRKIEEQMEEHRTLFNVSEILNRSDSIDENADLILQALNLGFNVQECAILLLEETGNMRLIGSVGVPEEKIGAIVACLSVSEIGSRVLDGETFVVQAQNQCPTDILVAPLKAARKIIGAMAVLRMKDKDLKDEALARSFSIISTTIAPHFLIGMSKEEKEQLTVSPFHAFIDSIDTEINKVKEYFGSLSLVMVRIRDFDKLCDDKGMQGAAIAVQELAVAFSASLGVVNENLRITEDAFVVILPMIDKFEASEVAHNAVKEGAGALDVETRLATYPEDGETGLDLLAALRKQT